MPARPLFALAVAFSIAACAPHAPIEGEKAASLIDCPALPETGPARAVAGSLIKGPFEDHRSARWREGIERIELRFLPVKSFPFVRHAMLVYTAADGRQFVIAGFPEDEFSPVLALGDIVTQVSIFDPRQKRFQEDLSEDSSRLLVVEGEDLADVWARMARVANVIEQLGVDYNLIGPNSNSVAATVLRYAGFTVPDVDVSGDFAFRVDVFEAAVETGEDVCDKPNVRVREVIDRE